MLAVQGPRRAASSPRSPDGELPRRFTTPQLTVAGVPACSSAAPATPARTASSCCSPPTARRRVWDAVIGHGVDARRARRARHAAPRGLLPPLRQRPRPRTATRSRRASAGAARRRRTSSAPQPIARRARRRHAREARAVRDHRPGHRAPGQPRRRRRRGHLRHALAGARLRHRPRLSAGRAHGARHGVRDRRARQDAAPPKSAPSP